MSKLNRLGRPERHVLFYDRWDGTGPVDFLGRPDPDARSPETIAESELVHVAVHNAGIRDALLETLELRAPAWMLLGELRPDVFPGDAEGKPGDFDIIVGELRDGRPEFDRLALVEVKRSPVRGDGRAKSRPSGLGTTQARGGAELGFDRVLLVHFVLGPDESIATPTDKASLPEHYGAVHAVVKSVRRADRATTRRPYGLLVVEWARGRGTHLARTGAIASTLAAPARPLPFDRPRRDRLEAHLRATLPADNCPSVLCRCRRCGLVVCTCT